MSEKKSEPITLGLRTVKNETKNELADVIKKEKFKKRLLNDIKNFIKLHEPFKIKMAEKAEQLMKSDKDLEKSDGEYYYLVLGYVKLIESNKMKIEEIEKTINSSIYT